MSKSSHLHDSSAAQERAEDAIVGKPAYSAAIAEFISEAFVALDSAWCVTYINHQATPLLRSIREALISRNFWEAFPDLVDSVFHLRCQEAVSTGISTRIEFKMLNRQKWFRIHILPSTEGIDLLFTDITQQKQAQEQQLFQANILRNISNSVIVTDFAGKISYWNEGADAIFGYSAQEMIGQTIAVLYPELDLAKTADGLQAIIDGQDYIGSWQGRRKDGATIWVDIRTTLLRDPDGKATGLIGIAKDITEQKYLEEELQRSKDQLEAILSNVADGVIVQDTIGKIIYANQTAAHAARFSSVQKMLSAPLLGYREQFEITDEQGQPFLPSQFPGRRAAHDAQEGGIAQVSIRTVNKQTGEVHWLQIKSTAVFDTNGAPSFVITVLQDITQFKELEKRKDDFILNVSHELRTPLTAINGFLELLKDHHASIDASTLDIFLSRALENCQELTTLVNVILDALQVKQEQEPIQSEKLLLAPCVHEVLAQLDPRITQKFLIQVAMPEQLTVWAEKRALQQILRNLLSNAAKFAQQQTPLVISAVLDEHSAQESGLPSQVRISVQDAGPGIPPDEQPLLFEQFSRLKRDLTGVVRGTGLGLYISRQLVERMGGRIWVESSGQAGEGSCFCFTLPCPPTPFDAMV